jgi:hypothetical protein
MLLLVVLLFSAVYMLLFCCFQVRKARNDIGATPPGREQECGEEDAKKTEGGIPVVKTVQAIM